MPKVAERVKHPDHWYFGRPSGPACGTAPRSRRHRVTVLYGPQ